LNRLSLNAPRNWVANKGTNRRARSKWATFWIKPLLRGSSSGTRARH